MANPADSPDSFVVKSPEGEVATALLDPPDAARRIVLVRSKDDLFVRLLRNRGSTGNFFPIFPR
jgi:hypothetical protein